MKRFVFYAVGIFLPISTLGGCASQKHNQPEVIESFSTNILDSGEKQFQFQLSMSRPEGQRGGGSRSKRGGGRRGGSHDSSEGPPLGRERDRHNSPLKENSGETKEKMRAMITERLDSRIKENGYCRKGFTILLQDIGIFGQSIIRAQCHELATEEDRAAFPNSEPKPQKPRVIYEPLD